MASLRRWISTKRRLFKLLLFSIILSCCVMLYRWSSADTESPTDIQPETRRKLSYEKYVVQETIDSVKSSKSSDTLHFHNKLDTIPGVANPVKQNNDNPQPANEIPQQKTWDRKMTTEKEINVMITFTNSKSNPALVEKFRMTVSSLLKYATYPLAIYIIGDQDSQKKAAEILSLEKQNATYRNISVDISEVIKDVDSVVKDMQKFFSYSTDSYYGKSLFFLSIAIHRVGLFQMEKAILIDCDLKFRSDILDLYSHFDQFQTNHIMGLARENQPVYRHTFSLYRSQNPGTRVGDPPPSGLTGFNSGVVLLNIAKMRSSVTYNSYLNSNSIQSLTQKYSFKGHLGDQDFFSLLSLEHEDLFYVLPCSWNRQLCTWWKDKGYKDVFDLYYQCNEKINIYHGNCNTPITTQHN